MFREEFADESIHNVQQPNSTIDIDNGRRRHRIGKQIEKIGIKKYTTKDFNMLAMEVLKATECDRAVKVVLPIGPRILPRD